MVTLVWYSHQVGSPPRDCHTWLSFILATVHENLGYPVTHLLFLNCLHLPVTLSAPQYVMTTMIDEGQRKEPRNLYSTDLSSQPLPVLPETLIWSVPNYWHSAEQATRSLQAWAAWVPSLEVQNMHPALQGLRALSRSDPVLHYLFLNCY